MCIRLTTLATMIFCHFSLYAQNDTADFRAYLYNNEYEVYLRINFYEQNIIIPGQELYGELPGYLGKKHHSFCWVITSCKLINDFGSEDLTATITRKNDSIYIFQQKEGNSIKVPHQGKWRKLPKTLIMKRDIR